MKSRAPIAVVGMGGIFPGAPDLDRFWANITAGVDGSREVPPHRWVLDAARAHDSEIGAADKVYSTRGCFIEDFHLDLRDLDLDPDVVAALDPLYHLALHAGRQAVEDAGLSRGSRDRVGVVIGNIALPTDSSSKIAREILGDLTDKVMRILIQIRQHLRKNRKDFETADMIRDLLTEQKITLEDRSDGTHWRAE